MRVKSVDGIDARRLPIEKDAGAANRAIICRRYIYPETRSIPAVAGDLPGGAATAALRRANSSDPKGSIYYCRSAWPMMSQQFSHEPDTRSRPSASPSVRMLPVYRRPAGDFISGTSLHSYERLVRVAGLFSYKTRLRRGAQLTWQTKCLSTPPTKRRHA
jgi:hypothetical protein